MRFAGPRLRARRRIGRRCTRSRCIKPVARVSEGTKWRKSDMATGMADSADSEQAQRDWEQEQQEPTPATEDGPVNPPTRTVVNPPCPLCRLQSTPLKSTVTTTVALPRRPSPPLQPTVATPTRLPPLNPTTTPALQEQVVSPPDPLQSNINAHIRPLPLPVVPLPRDTNTPTLRCLPGRATSPCRGRIWATRRSSSSDRLVRRICRSEGRSVMAMMRPRGAGDGG